MLRLNYSHFWIMVSGILLPYPGGSDRDTGDTHNPFHKRIPLESRTAEKQKISLLRHRKSKHFVYFCRQGFKKRKVLIDITSGFTFADIICCASGDV